MNLENEIRKEHSKRQVVAVAGWIGTDPRRFASLVELFRNGDRLLSRRASWIIGTCGERHPELIEPWISPLLQKAKEENVHPAVQRNVLRAFQFIDIPKRHRGAVVNLCFDLLSSVDAPVAVKVFSMSVLANIIKKEPDLKNELTLVITQLLPYGTAGMRAREKKILKQLAQ
ncbi:MAG: hypothetical protein WCT99_06500 [Bacteroidota bacterium]